MGMQRRKWTISALAVETGRTPRLVAESLSGVEPCEVKRQKGRELRYYWGRDAFPALYAIEEKTVVHHRDRLAELKAQELELDIMERRGNLVQLPAIHAACESLALEVGAVFDGIPHSVAHECVGKSADAIAAIIKSVLDSARAVVAEIRVAVPELPDSGQRPAANGHGVVGR